MTPGLAQLIAIAVLFALLAAVIDMTVFASLNHHVLLAIGVGLLLGGGVIVGSVAVGVPLIAVSVTGLQLLVIAAAVGALIGHIGIISTVKPTTH